MTRYKKELIKAGFQLECSFPWLPYDVGSVTLEGVSVRLHDDHIAVTEHYVVGDLTRWVGKDLKEDYEKQIFD